MEKNITKRLAAQNLSTAKVPVEWLFKIVETILGSKIVSVSSHMSQSGKSFCVIVFEKTADAKKIYDFCDGMHIEDTNEYFELSFIPDVVDIGPTLEICKDSKNFRYEKIVNSHEALDYGNMIELSDEENELGDPIPTEKLEENFPLSPVVEQKNPVKEKELAKMEEVTKALRQSDDKEELDGFSFDITDPRFEVVFTDKDFVIDASHRKFSRKCGMTEVLNEVRRRYDGIPRDD
ncbi:hypothetical protein PAEPH01_0435 [Pancytospora epiphaga]|nr:hypothetical protein PAEPH01_0435 [Pancytospora epiphaga]